MVICTLSDVKSIIHFFLSLIRLKALILPQIHELHQRILSETDTSWLCPKSKAAASSHSISDLTGSIIV